jgi:hypothetical protein
MRRTKQLGVASLAGIAATVWLLAVGAGPAAGAADEAEVGVSVTVVEPTPAPTDSPAPTQVPSTPTAPADTDPGSGTADPELSATGMPPWVFAAAWVAGALVLSGAGALALGRRRAFLPIESETAR